MAISQTLSGFVFDLKYEDIPAPVIEHSKSCLTDCIGNLIAGLDAQPARMVSGYFREVGGAPQATIVGQDWKAPAPNAALVNGTGAHTLDYDDYNSSSNGSMAHPTAVLLPAVLAAGELVQASGKAVLTAYIAGTEIEGKIGAGVNPELYRKGWHSTSVLGTLAAALAVGKVIGLDVDGLVRAFGIAASMAGGLRCNFGTMTKPFHAGHAASAGVLAALMAERGMSSEPDVVDTEAGFCKAFIGEEGYDSSRMIASLGNPWDILDPGIHIKQYPCVAAVHPAVDAVLAMRRKSSIAPDDVQRIEIGLPPMAIKELLKRYPVTALEAKFSAEFCVSISLLEGKTGLSQFTDSQVVRKDVQELMRKAHAKAHPDLSGNGYHADPMAIVKLVLKDGSTLTQRVDIPKGHARNPLTRKEIQTKFGECVGYRWQPDKAETVLASLYAIDEVPSICQLTSKLT